MVANFHLEVVYLPSRNPLSVPTSLLFDSRVDSGNDDMDPTTQVGKDTKVPGVLIKLSNESEDL